MSVIILASRYNTLRNSVNLVLGQSSTNTPTYGYGQGFSTNSKIGSQSTTEPVDADKISAQDYEDLYVDMIRARSHQVGASVAIDEFVIGDYDTNAEFTDKVEEAYIIGLESLATNLETDKFLVDTNNLRLTNAPLANSSRSDTEGAWNGILTHIFTMTFTTELERRHFFNAGGEIRLSASVDYTGSQAKTVDWQSILNDMGSTSFKATETVNNASVGSGSAIGNYNLTNSYQLVYSRTGGAAYARNRYNIYAQNLATVDGTSRIQFKVEFEDLAPNDATFGIDESVFGTFNSNVQTATPDSEIIINGTLYPAVSIETDPIGATVKALDGAPVTSYAVLTDVTSVDEGSSVPFTVNTSNVVTGTTLYWTTKIESGTVNISDFTDSTNSGSFIINSNTSSIVRTLTADITTEGIESFRLEIRVGSTSGTIVATSSLITINDSSQTPAPPSAPEPEPEPTPSGFEFTVTPELADWSFIVGAPNQDSGESFIMTGIAGNGTITVQETSRPDAWNVYVDNVKGSNSPPSTATKTFTLGAGEQKTVTLRAEATTYTTESGAFAWVGSNGTSITKTWTGQWLPPSPTISYTPSTGIINDTNYTLSWDANGASSATVVVQNPIGETTTLNDLSGSISSTLGVVGTWTSTISTSRGSASTSVNVTEAPPPQEPPTPVFAAPTLSFTPSSGTINNTIYTLSWDDNGAGAVTVVLQSPDGGRTTYTNSSDNFVNTLGIVGTWTATIETNGGSLTRSVIVEAESSPPPASGTLLSTFCQGFDLYGTYANGSGGTYDELIETNSSSCGYTPPAPSYSISLSIGQGTWNGSTTEVTAYISGGIPNTSFDWAISPGGGGAATTDTGGNATLSAQLPPGSYVATVSQSGAGSDSVTFQVFDEGP